MSQVTMRIGMESKKPMEPSGRHEAVGVILEYIVNLVWEYMSVVASTVDIA